MLELESRLEALTHEGAPKVRWRIDSGFTTDIPEMEKINKALVSISAKEKLELTTQLFSLYLGNDREAQKRIFGDLSIGLYVLGTLTDDGRQFRIWDRVPGYMTYDHVDNGPGLLEVVGDPREVIKYVHALVSERFLEAKFENGVKMYCMGK